MDQLRLGDNVIWHVDDLDDYRAFTALFAERARADGRSVVYVRFGQHPPITELREPDVRWVRLQPQDGFEPFSAAVHALATEEGIGTYYLFDCLSELVEHWDTEEMLANFFQSACPYLYELRTIAYFPLLRGRHSNQMVARIYNTTQVFVEIFRVGGGRSLHLIKVWDRYSPGMFYPQRISGDELRQAFDPMTLEDGGNGSGEDPRLTSPWESVHQRLVAASGERAGGEVGALKDEFSRMLLGRHPEFDRLAARFLGLPALLRVRERLIGSGRIGGKATGVLLAHEILKDRAAGMSDPSVLEDHDSWYVGSDVYFSFLVQNDLFRLRVAVSEGERFPYREIERRFLAGDFPPAIALQLRGMLEYFGQSPIIVRSSSLLEDSFGGAFAGKYRSVFCPNQGSVDENLEALTRAIKRVYASSLSPDALSYRRRRNLVETEELMAILVQRVSGIQYRRYLFPTLAGVGFSHNLYAWNDRIDPSRGVIRLVFGLGTRAVDRVERDYPRMIAVSHPLLRPEVGVEAAKYSQHEVDVIDLEENEFVTVPSRDLLEEATYPGQHMLVSIWNDEHLDDPYSRFLEPRRNFVLTFNNLLRQTPFVRVFGEVLEKLERAYERSVDIEFTTHLENSGRVRINLLQCRPLWTHESSIAVTIPEDVPKDRILFRAHRVITGGVVEDIRFLVYIDPAGYSAIDYPPDKKTLGRIVGRVNRHRELAPQRLVFMGPGRWGSRNVDLGVNVGYADIDNADVLVELSSAADEHDPELSYGTHFFLDLVEEHIIYLPVFPEREASGFNHAFFREGPNHLEHFLPDCASMAHAIKLIDLSRLGLRARLLANPQEQEAMCYLAEGAAG